VTYLLVVGKMNDLAIPATIGAGSELDVPNFLKPPEALRNLHGRFAKRIKFRLDQLGIGIKVPEVINIVQ
jgi:hypothetical protein